MVLGMASAAQAWPDASVVRAAAVAKRLRGIPMVGLPVELNPFRVFSRVVLRKHRARARFRGPHFVSPPARWRGRNGHVFAEDKARSGRQWSRRGGRGPAARYWCSLLP